MSSPNVLSCAVIGFESIFMINPPRQFVWVFMGVGARFPSGVFSARDNAEHWIAENKLTGMLTAYPVDNGVFDWARAAGYEGKRTELTPIFIGSYASRLEHYHYSEGCQM